MRKGALGYLGFWGAAAGVLAGFHFWGEHARARDWWYVSGDRDGLIFLDLRNIADEHGHLLMTDFGDGAVAGDEFNVSWSCSSRQISYGASWRLDSEMQQIERQPPPAAQAEMHNPQNWIDKQVLAIACAGDIDRPRLALRVARPPMEITKRAIEGARKGEDPRKAFRAAVG